MTIKYYYLVMSQKDMLQNQIIEEILRERANYQLSKKKTLDFWVLIAPKFLTSTIMKEKISATNFFQQHKSEIYDSKENSFYSCLVSLDKDFIKWIQLRLGYFENIEIKNLNISYCVSNGFFGEVNSNFLEESPLISNRFFFNPKILSQKLEASFEISFSNRILEYTKK